VRHCIAIAICCFITDACSSPPPPAPVGVPAPMTTASALNGLPLDSLPALVPGTCRAPRYPEALRQQGIGGQVAVEFVVDWTGEVQPSTLRSAASTDPRFEQPALVAIRTCRYHPAMQGGQAVSVRVRTLVTFFVAGSRYPRLPD
jgi:TonB family protein